ncbi:calcium-binding protein, partial [Paraburkholderia xenovorans]|uniref:calcium-binding protein n=1 Tax=Paraburkholderia xenovorans TaxID=36873 RepID=UPI0038BCD3EB
SSAQVFDGKGGDDYEQGLGGGDTFVFDAGYGHLEINEKASSSTSVNTLALGAGLSAGSLVVRATEGGAGLVLTDGLAGDQITLDSMLLSGLAGVQKVEFADGTVWTRQQLILMETTGTTGADSLYGSNAGELFDGKGGDDHEYGGGGGDTFVFNAGYGHLEISEIGGEGSVLQLGEGISRSSLSVRVGGNLSDLVLADGIAGDEITLDGALASSGVQEVQFSDGTLLTAKQLLQIEMTGTDASDTLYGSAGADLIDGKGGDDSEVGGGGSDTFAFNAGYGHLEIYESYYGVAQ